jgi:hypothetical protein
VDLESIQSSAAKILVSSPIPYIQNAQPRGTLFNPSTDDGSVCSASTDFFIDHTEPQEALQKVKERGIEWPLGDLGEGCEFLLIVRGETKLE